ncbi:Conjugal transfer protein TrbL [Frankia sp. AgKG'84/4]
MARLRASRTPPAGPRRRVKVRMAVFVLAGGLAAGAAGPALAAPTPAPAPAAPAPAPAPPVARPAPAAPGSLPAPPAASPAPPAPPATPSPNPAPVEPSPSRVTPRPSPGPSPDPDAGRGVSLIPGFLRGLTNIPGKIADAINSWLTGLAEGALGPVMKLLGATVLSTEDVTTRPTIRQMWWDNLAIADSLMLLVLTAAGLIAMAHDTLQTRTTAKDLAPRIVVGFVTAHLSLPLMSLAIGLSNGVAKAIAGERITADGIGAALSTALAVNKVAPFIVLILLCAAAMAIALIVGWAVRLLVLMMLAVAAPLLLIWHGLPPTAGLARLWWRALFGCLAVQVSHALLLLVGLRVLLADPGHALAANTSSLLNILMCCGMFALALRLEGWITRLVIQGTGGPSPVVTLVKYKALRAGMKAIGA